VPCRRRVPQPSVRDRPCHDHPREDLLSALQALRRAHVRATLHWPHRASNAPVRHAPRQPERDQATQRAASFRVRHAQPDRVNHRMHGGHELMASERDTPRARHPRGAPPPSEMLRRRGLQVPRAPRADANPRQERTTEVVHAEPSLAHGAEWVHHASNRHRSQSPLPHGRCPRSASALEAPALKDEVRVPSPQFSRLPRSNTPPRRAVALPCAPSRKATRAPPSPSHAGLRVL